MAWFSPLWRDPHGLLADDPEAAAFERKLRIDETGGEGGEVERTGAEVEIGNEVDPKGVDELAGEMADVDHVHTQHAEQEHRLAPLGRVAPEHMRARLRTSRARVSGSSHLSWLASFSPRPMG